MDKHVLITGASGLLGQALVQRFVDGGFFVFAQYHNNVPFNIKNCEWLQADFSYIEGIHDFLVENCLKFKPCNYLINNYGPITNKDISELTTDDFYFDFHHNVITAFEITDFFIKYTSLESVVNIGFDDVGTLRPYKRILTYAAAKNALQLITTSFAEKYENIRFNMVAPSTMVGADVRSPNGKQTPPHIIAADVFRTATGVDS